MEILITTISIFCIKFDTIAILYHGIIIGLNIAVIVFRRIVLTRLGLFGLILNEMIFI